MARLASGMNVDDLLRVLPYWINDMLTFQLAKYEHRHPSRHVRSLSSPVGAGHPRTNDSVGTDPADEGSAGVQNELAAEATYPWASVILHASIVVADTLACTLVFACRLRRCRRQTCSATGPYPGGPLRLR
jgi:hypothetical protein